ncbi:ABC transporter substrate-binding protein [Microtetraspora malaysiensis]|uniref:ABC transporter substrate-binding protein n=1 Tax=Microtetraspora malaysiensis TaxID=161358 RepID=UPI003D94FBE2
MLALASAVALLAACGGESLGGTSGSGGGGTSDSIKVGLVVAQSGVVSSVGRDMENGLKLYLDQHKNTLGGKKVNLITVDEGATAQSGAAAVTRVVQQEQADVVVGVTIGPTAMAGRDIFDSSQTPAVMGNTGAVALGKDLASTWVWRASYDNAQPGRALGEKLAKDESAGKFFLIAADYSGGHETLAGFKETFAAGRIAGELYTPYGTTTDFSPYLSKIRASGAKNVFSFYTGAEAIAFTKQFHQFGLSDSVKLYSAGFLTPEPDLNAEGEAALGVLNSTRYNWDLDNAENKAFVPAYEKAFGSVPTVYAATMYDVGAILDNAVSKIQGQVTRSSINDALGRIGTVNGVRGPLTFDDTRTVQQHFYLTEVQKTDAGLRNVTSETLPKP